MIDESTFATGDIADADIAAGPASEHGPAGDRGQSSGKAGKQPRTEKQRAASRVNGARSRGPTSAYGKRVASQNASGHRATAALLAGNDGDAAELQALADDLAGAYAPASSVEWLLVNQLVDVRWRLLRVARALAERVRQIQINETETLATRQWLEQNAGRMDPAAVAGHRAAMAALREREPESIPLRDAEGMLAKELAGRGKTVVQQLMQLEITLTSQSLAIGRYLERSRAAREKGEQAAHRSRPDDRQR